MAKDLTKGSITPLILKFTLPLVLGQLFQLTYNAVDVAVLGNFVDEKAMAAAGIGNPIVNLFILLLNGLTLGAGILMGAQFGAGEIEKLERQISTTMLAGIVFALALSAACIAGTDGILILMQVHQELFEVSAIYLRIILAGMVFTYIYNCLAATLRSLGDSMTPLIFLIISSVLNVLGDLLFVVAFGWGVEGCAVSTVLSEAVSCVLCLIYIQVRVPILRLGKKWFVFDKSLLGKTVSYGWASAMQQATVQLGKIGVQAMVDTMGTVAPAAFTAVNKMDDYAMVPQQNIAHAMSAFMSQNRGAGEKERVKIGFRQGIIIEVIYGLMIGTVTFFFATPIMRIFQKENLDVVALGAEYLEIIAFMYIFPALTNGIQGYFRGMGRLKITLAASMINMGVRVLVAAVLIFGFSMDLAALPFAYMAGWIGMFVLEVPILFKELVLHTF